MASGSERAAEGTGTGITPIRFAKAMRRWICALAMIALTSAAGEAFGAENESPEPSAPAPSDIDGKTESKEGSVVHGRFRPARPRATPEIDEETYQRLIGLGYLQGYATPPSKDGVTVLQNAHTQPGLNLVVSGHAPTAQIIDLEGNVLHTWRYKAGREIWPDFAHPDAGLFWRRAHVYPNGDLLAIYDYGGLIKLDKNSRLLFAHRGRRHAHHDLEVAKSGLIYVLTAEKRILPAISSNEILDEYITVLSPNGAVLKEHSIIDLIANSELAQLFERTVARSGGFFGHVLHTNTLEVFDGRAASRSPLFRRGNVLISILMMDTIAIADLAQGKIVWTYGRNALSRQHQPTLLENGHMLVFDNRPGETCSRVVELEPLEKEVVWTYDGCSNETFHSSTCGSNQRLANGNTLITETDNGRAFEITKESTIVWEYVNPHRAGADRELVASLLEVVRLDRRALPFLRNGKKRKP